MVHLHYPGEDVELFSVVDVPATAAFVLAKGNITLRVVEPESRLITVLVASSFRVQSSM